MHQSSIHEAEFALPDPFPSGLFGRVSVLIFWCLLWWRRRCWLPSLCCVLHRRCCRHGFRLLSWWWGWVFWTWGNNPHPLQGFRQLVNLGIVLQQFPGKLLTCEWQEDFDLYWVGPNLFSVYIIYIYHDKETCIWFNLQITMYTQPVVSHGKNQEPHESHHFPSMPQVLLP